MVSRTIVVSGMEWLSLILLQLAMDCWTIEPWCKLCQNQSYVSLGPCFGVWRREFLELSLPWPILSLIIKAGKLNPGGSLKSLESCLKFRFKWFTICFCWKMRVKLPEGSTDCISIPSSQFPRGHWTPSWSGHTVHSSRISFLFLG